MRQSKGFTVIELVIAGGIFIVLLSAMANLFSSSSKAYLKNEDASQTIQDQAAGTSLLE